MNCIYCHEKCVMSNDVKNANKALFNCHFHKNKPIYWCQNNEIILIYIHFKSDNYTYLCIINQIYGSIVFKKHMSFAHGYADILKTNQLVFITPENIEEVFSNLLIL